MLSASLVDAYMPGVLTANKHSQCYSWVLPWQLLTLLMYQPALTLYQPALTRLQLENPSADCFPGSCSHYSWPDWLQTSTHKGYKDKKSIVECFLGSCSHYSCTNSLQTSTHNDTEMKSKLQLDRPMSRELTIPATQDPFTVSVTFVTLITVTVKATWWQYFFQFVIPYTLYPYQTSTSQGPPMQL